jgi:hypothetical protein
MEYDEIVSAPLDAITRVTEYLQLDCCPAVLQAVAEETSFESVKEKVRRLDADDEGRLTRVGEVAYDPDTLLHRSHIRDGRSGYGRDFLTPEELETCASLLDRYVNTRDADVVSSFADSFRR